jgi:perosamine synthetase
MMEIPLARPEITEKEIEAVVAVLRTPNLSLGPKLEEFERRLADYVGTKYGVAVNSGTSALHLIIKALGISEGDEVITTPSASSPRPTASSLSGPDRSLWTSTRGP